MVIIKSLTKTRYGIHLDIIKRDRQYKYENVCHSKLKYIEAGQSREDYCYSFYKLDEFIEHHNLFHEIHKHNAPKGLILRFFMGIPSLKPNEVYYEMYDNVYGKYAIITKHNFHMLKYNVEDKTYGLNNFSMQGILKELTATEIMEFMRDNKIRVLGT